MGKCAFPDFRKSTPSHFQIFSKTLLKSPVRPLKEIRGSFHPISAPWHACRKSRATRPTDSTSSRKTALAVMACGHGVQSTRFSPSAINGAVFGSPRATRAGRRRRHLMAFLHHPAAQLSSLQAFLHHDFTVPWYSISPSPSAVWLAFKKHGFRGSVKGCFFP